MSQEAFESLRFYIHLIKTSKRHTASVLVGWAGLGWAGLGWAGLGWAGLGWAGLGWAGLGCAGLGCAGLGCAGLGRTGQGSYGIYMRQEYFLDKPIQRERDLGGQ